MIKQFLSRYLLPCPSSLSWPQPLLQDCLVNCQNFMKSLQETSSSSDWHQGFQTLSSPCRRFLGKFQFLWVHYLHSLIAEVCGRSYKYSIQISSFLPRQLIDLVSSSFSPCVIFSVICTRWPLLAFADTMEDSNDAQGPTSLLRALQLYYRMVLFQFVVTYPQNNVILQTSDDFKDIVSFVFPLAQVESLLLSQAFPALFLKFAQVKPFRSPGTRLSFSKPLQLSSLPAFPLQLPIQVLVCPTEITAPGS